MKIFTLVVLVAIFSRATICQTTKPTEAELAKKINCNLEGGNGRVLKWLKSSGISIEQAPKKATEDICGGDFKTSGTCCNLEQMKAFVKSKNDQAIASWGSYISGLQRINSKIKPFLKKFSLSMSNKHLKTQLAKLKAKPNFQKAFKFSTSLLDMDDSQFTQMKETIAKFDEQLKDFKSNGKKCFETMRKARAMMFCALCDARASQFTLPQVSSDISFRVPYDSCNALVNDCFTTWKFNFEILSIMDFVKIMKAKPTGSEEPEDSLKKDMMSSDRLTATKKAFQACKIEDGKIACPIAGVNKIDVKTHVSYMCRNLFSVSKTNPYVEGSGKIDEGVTAEELEKKQKDIIGSIAGGNLDPKKLQEKLAAVAISKRVLADDPNIGISAQTSPTGTFQNLMKDDPVVPTSSVDTEKATAAPADSSNTESGLRLSGVTFILVSLSALALF